ncbi:glycosyltransferase [Evansella sp. LMS18]|uniref:glycosyltransferase n=1 Tax=Evansella sp. LMS18 TaxID=2924033 RepID=UPI0020D18F7E|nr:glycosyltransferase [Evansella sp. LMS18]UTR10573.1 glycosyltransferase [Evansella sp. LMS18]
MKKKLLFVIDSLDVAGAEKSLVTLLSMLDYSRFSVDLMLFSHGKTLEKLLPEEVNILPPLKYTNFSKLSLYKSVLYSTKNKNFKMLNARIIYSANIRRKTYSNPQKARIFWESAADVIEANPETYDIAIAYAQCIPTFYVADKVKANKKLAWVNVSYRLEDEDKVFQKKFYEKFDSIVAVSNKTKEIFTETFPEYWDQTEVIFDITNPEFISKMAELGKGFNDEFEGIKILTIGRLANQKGYDIAIKACHMLKEQGNINFRWYALGKGPLEKTIRASIEEKGLSDHFILLGVEANPYPYIKNSDIYVQTSRFEGFGIAIAEARMLNIPVVTTRFDAVFTQMVSGKNGLVVDMNPEAVYEGILKLHNDKELRSSIRNYLKSEKKGNVEEIQKFYKIIG